MSLAELYPWLKALHVAVAITFVGGTLAISVFLASASIIPEEAPALARAMRRWDQAVTIPAMMLVWALGLALATTGHWFADHWLQAKLATVVTLSAIHGVSSGQLRRLGCGARIRAWRLAPLVLLCILVIAALAVVKP